MSDFFVVIATEVNVEPSLIEQSKNESHGTVCRPLSQTISYVMGIIGAAALTRTISLLL